MGLRLPLPARQSRSGDPVEFFGGAIALDDFATRSGTIGYALLTSLGPRHQREYVRQPGATRGSGARAPIRLWGPNSLEEKPINVPKR